MPMGIANHTFYQEYEKCIENPSNTNPFYALLLTGDGKFLDSHLIGIDGPLMHLDANSPA